MGLIDITEHLGVEVKNTPNLEILIIQHVMLSHTVLAQAMPPHSLFLNKRDINLGYQYIYHKIYLKTFPAFPTTDISGLQPQLVGK